MKERLFYIIICVLLVGCNTTPELEVKLHECASMPSWRASATSFVVDGAAYVFAGRDSLGRARKDLWRYDPATDSWSSLGDTPLAPRVNATSCSHDGKVYLGLGFDGNLWDDSFYLRDWWEYSPATNQWRRLADYPNASTDRAISFAGNGELYVGYGFRYNYRRDMFRYTIAEDRWDSIDVHVDMHGFPIRSFGGAGCTCQNRHFMGSGFYGHSLDWWAELVDGTHWEKRATMPGKTRTLAASAATDRYLYVTGGLHYGGVNTTGDVLRDIRRYDPQKDSWTFVTILPNGLYNHCCFVIDKQIFVGLGETEDEQMNTALYRFEE